jgi:hypothetical protein
VTATVDIPFVLPGGAPEPANENKPPSGLVLETEPTSMDSCVQ